LGQRDPLALRQFVVAVVEERDAAVAAEKRVAAHASGEPLVFVVVGDYCAMLVVEHALVVAAAAAAVVGAWVVGVADSAREVERLAELESKSSAKYSIARVEAAAAAAAATLEAVDCY
jgi:hypothetical protein